MFGIYLVDTGRKLNVIIIIIIINLFIVDNKNAVKTSN